YRNDSQDLSVSTGFERSAFLQECRLTARPRPPVPPATNTTLFENRPAIDRKSTRLNSSHVAISYAVFCLKKKSGDKRGANHLLRLARQHPYHGVIPGVSMRGNHQET